MKPVLFFYHDTCYSVPVSTVVAVAVVAAVVIACLALGAWHFLARG